MISRRASRTVNNVVPSHRALIKQLTTRLARSTGLSSNSLRMKRLRKKYCFISIFIVCIQCFLFNSSKIFECMRIFRSHVLETLRCVFKVYIVSSCTFPQSYVSASSRIYTTWNYGRWSRLSFLSLARIAGFHPLLHSASCPFTVLECTRIPLCSIWLLPHSIQRNFAIHH